MIDLIRTRLQEKQLKITPQRIAIYEAICKLNNHPTAENIIEYIRRNHPNISVGTVYKVLDCLTEHNLLKRVKTERDIMRYDAMMNNHHHLYCTDTDRIEDYEDKNLDQLIINYFQRKKIKNFRIKEIKLQITGNFKNKK